MSVATVQDPELKSRESAVEHAKALLGRLQLSSPDPFDVKKWERFEVARPEEYLADLLEFCSARGIPEEEAVRAFKDGVSDVLPTWERPTYDRKIDKSARKITEHLINLLTGVANPALKDSQTVRSSIAKLRDECSPEDFKKNILPLIRALNKALAARQGVEGMGRDYHLLQEINGHRNVPYGGGLQLDPWNEVPSQTPGEYAKDLLKRYEKEPVEDPYNQGLAAKKATIVPRLHAILARIESLRGFPAEMGNAIENVQIWIPRLDKDQRVLKYDIETEVGLVEEQLAYFEKYLADRNRMKVAAELAREQSEAHLKALEISGRLSAAEMNIADLLPKIRKLQGSETEKGSVDFVRAEAEENDVRVHIAKSRVQGCFHEVEPIKPAMISFSRDQKYIGAVCAVLDSTIGSLEALQKDDSTTLARNRKFLESKGTYRAPKWEKNFARTDIQLPADDVKGEARLGVLEPMNTRLAAQKPLLDAAHAEADALKKELAPQCASMIDRLTELKGKVRGLLATKSHDGIRERVLDELETFRKENANIFA